MRRLTIILPIMLTAVIAATFAPAKLIAVTSPVVSVSEAPAEEVQPVFGMVEGTGTVFEVTDSLYRNVTLTSSESVDITLASYPRLIELAIAPSTAPMSTELTLSGLAADTEYWKYEAGGTDPAALTSDGAGMLTFVKDLSEADFVWFQEHHSTKYLRDDAGGGDCHLIGVWDPGIKTCTLTVDLSEQITVADDDITLDGANHQITATYPEGGVLLVNRTGVTVKNLNVYTPWASDNGIRLIGSSGNTITGNTVQGFFRAISLWQGSNNNVITGNHLSAAGEHLVGIFWSQNPYIADNTLVASRGTRFGVIQWLDANELEVVNNNFFSFRPSSNRWTMWINGSATLSHAPPVGGNYYDYYDEPAEGCTDADGDGFCDLAICFRTDYSDCDEYPYTQPIVFNQSPIVEAGGEYTAVEGAAVSLSDATASDPDGDELTYQWSVDSASCHFSDATTLNPLLTCDDNGDYVATLSASDSEQAPVTSDAAIMVNNVAPTIEVLTTPDRPEAIDDQPIVVSASFTDPGVGDSHTAEWNWGDLTSSAGTVIETGGSGTTSGSHTYTDPGVYTVTLTVTDKDGGADVDDFQYVVIYDPSAGFVTGGGWIPSNPGAYLPDPELEGRATFGFVSKYKKGATVPTGNTEFQFMTADLKFHSNSYEWLVVTGQNSARFKGVGTINGSGLYKFMIWASDGDSDTFRIKIWEEDEASLENTVYDNGFDQPLGGGSIIVHTKK